MSGESRNVSAEQCQPAGGQEALRSAYPPFQLEVILQVTQSKQLLVVGSISGTIIASHDLTGPSNSVPYAVQCCTQSRPLPACSDADVSSEVPLPVPSGRQPACSEEPTANELPGPSTDLRGCGTSSANSSSAVIVGATTIGKVFLSCLFPSGQLTSLAEVDLPGNVFGSPVVFGQYILVGCRDDYLYCIQWS